MPSDTKHPVRRVRDAIKSTPKEMGLRQFATSAGFARFVGRSASLIRNVECGITLNWESLAKRIEEKMNVSSQWLLSKPGMGDPILDIDDRPWCPIRELDPLSPKEDMPDWRTVLNVCPEALPSYIARLVEAQLVLELSLGHQLLISRIVELFARSGTFVNPALGSPLHDEGKELEEAMRKKLWPPNTRESGQPVWESGSILAKLSKEGVESLKLEDLQGLLRDEGFGWVGKLDKIPDKGIISNAYWHFRWIYPQALGGYPSNEEIIETEPDPSE